MRRAFIVGGAGFIGSALAWRLAPGVDSLVIYDNLHEQVHGAEAPRLPPSARLVEGDVRSPDALYSALLAADPDVIYHLAAETGTAQSYDLPALYCEVNVSGSCHLVQAIRSLPPRPRRLVLASSRAVYGEGAYRTADGDRFTPPARRLADLQAGRFDPLDDQGRPLKAVATRETEPTQPASVYASTKLMQEMLLLQATVGSDVEPVTLRLQNVYGPGQSLRNLYTGVLSIFADQILRGQHLDIYEDGRTSRDFVFVDDVVEALLTAGGGPYVGAEPINIGAGVPTTIDEAAGILLQALGAPADRKRVSGRFRIGDIRHAFADISRAAARLQWRPTTSLETGLGRLAAWARERHLEPAVATRQ